MQKDRTRQRPGTNQDTRKTNQQKTSRDTKETQETTKEPNTCKIPTKYEQKEDNRRAKTFTRDQKRGAERRRPREIRQAFTRYQALEIETTKTTKTERRVRKKPETNKRPAETRKD